MTVSAALEKVETADPNQRCLFESDTYSVLRKGEFIVKQIRKRITYANVMSSLAVFLVLGGATAFAAGQLAKNSVGSKQLKKNAVTTAKIKNNAVTTAKLKNGAVTGAKVDVSAFPTVPSAANATNAAHASNADTVSGRSVTKIFVKLPPNSAKRVVLSAVGFNILVGCSGAGNPEIELDPQTSESDIDGMGNGTPKGAFFEREQGAEPNSIDLTGENERGEVTFTAAQSSGSVLTGTLGFDDTNSFNGETVCGVWGEASF